MIYAVQINYLCGLENIASLELCTFISDSRLLIGRLRSKPSDDCRQQTQLNIQIEHNEH